MSNQVDESTLLDELPDSPTEYFNYGKLTIGYVYVDWSSGSRVETTPQLWADLPEKTADGKSAKAIDITLSIDIQEFNPNLGFGYNRKVTLNSADWNKTVKPAIEKICGAKSLDKGNRSKTLRNLQGKYVSGVDAPQLPRGNNSHINDKTGQPYMVCKLMQVFESREACLAAKEARSASYATAHVIASPNEQPTNGLSLPASWSQMGLTEQDWLGFARETKSKNLNPIQLRKEAESAQVSVDELKATMEKV